MANYVRDSSVFNILTSPIIWIVLMPVVLLHMTASVFQWFCFPVYGIPKVRQGDYMVIDRRVLKYCEYVNGALAYVSEIAGRTEQYWCPIKHAIGLKTRHSRYAHFLDFGDAEQYRHRIEQVRRDFQDIQKAE